MAQPAAAPRRIDLFLALIAAWKRRDIDDVLSRLDDRIVWHFAAGAEPPLVGKVAARKFLTRFGADITHELKVTPALIGGIRVQLGSDVWDGSVSGRLQHLQSTLNNP